MTDAAKLADAILADAANAQTAAHDWILWDVVEEHLDELAFALEGFCDESLDPGVSFEEFALGSQARVIEHLDALIVAGLAPQRVLYEKALREDSDPMKVCAAALAWLESQKHCEKEVGVSSDNRPVAVVEAIVREIAGGDEPERTWGAGLALQLSGRPAAVRPKRADHMSPESSLADSVVEDRPGAWEHCSAVALGAMRGFGTRDVFGTRDAIEHADVVEPTSATTEANEVKVANRLYAALGSHTAHQALLNRLAQYDPGAISCWMVEALGLSGSPQVADALLARLSARAQEEGYLVSLEPALIFEAVHHIAGESLLDPSLCLAEQETPPIQSDAVRTDEIGDDMGDDDSLPPLEKDLEQSLVPPVWESLPWPNIEELCAAWSQRRGRFSSRSFYVLGLVESPAAFADALRVSSMRTQNLFALAVAARTGGVVTLETPTWAQRRAAALSRLSKLTRLRERKRS